MNVETMNTKKLRSLYDYGQSFWLDNLTREMLHNGDLKLRIEKEGLRGITSNPKTFSTSLQSSSLYGEDIDRMVLEGKDSETIYEALMVEDVRKACDLFDPLYNKTNGADGYVSIEVDPRLALDAEATLEMVRHLRQVVGRPNVMIKIPATVECLPVIEEALYEGINVNITLIFSVKRYRDVSASFLRAMRRREQDGLRVKRIASVASFFLSRIDAKVDQELEKAVRFSPHEEKKIEKLFGKAAIAQARTAYADYRSTYESDAWGNALGAKGASPQRLLWASTSVKSERYPETLYVDSLIADETVNTMPEETIFSFSENGDLRKNAILEAGLEPDELLKELSNLGIDLERIATDLEREGIEKFVEPFEEGLRWVVRQAKQARGDAV